MSEKNK